MQGQIIHGMGGRTFQGRDPGKGLGDVKTRNPNVQEIFLGEMYMNQYGSHAPYENLSNTGSCESSPHQGLGTARRGKVGFRENM